MVPPHLLPRRAASAVQNHRHRVRGIGLRDDDSGARAEATRPARTGSTLMADMEQSAVPSLIVVTGQPGAGKTTLAHALARSIRCPAICRDEIKEGFINTRGQVQRIDKPAPDAAWHVYQAFFDTVELLLSRRVTLIAEAAFQHKVWAPKLEPLQQIAR